PDSYILFLSRQEKNAKEGDRGVLPPKGGSLCCKSKNGKARKLAFGFALGTCACKRMLLRRRAACSLHGPAKTPATPQTSALLFPFSALQQRHRHIGTAKRQQQLQNQLQSKAKQSNSVTTAVCVSSCAVDRVN
ncbi:hypothetical protein, partial [Undibacterium sp. TS12]|uniref:hypothetical protein n=1 Tax=Undibacterium sp. TS12 TaxID=2908202 RepID=UPI001F4D0F1D